MLEKPGGYGRHTDKSKGLDFFSKNPRIALEGRSRPEGLCSRERIDFLVLGVCGCSRIQSGSGVGAPA